MKNTMEVETTRIMASLLYSYIGRGTRKLIHRLGDAQRHCKMGSIKKIKIGNFLI
jgi:hypothetical protein